MGALLAGEAKAMEAALARLGLTDARAGVQRVGALVEGLTPAERERLVRGMVRGLSQCADADQALTQLERLAQERAAKKMSALHELEAESLELATRLAGFSQFFGGLLIRYPDYVEWLGTRETLAPARRMGDYLAIGREALGAGDSFEARRLIFLRRMRRELLRLGARRMLGLSDEFEMCAELSDQARAAIELALEEVWPSVMERFGQPFDEVPGGEEVSPKASRFAVIALGKLGGGELNFSSDVDLIFLYSAEGTTTGTDSRGGSISNHHFFTRLAEDLVNYLSEHSEEGRFYRVDTRLRPDGDSGPLVRSYTAYEVYYTTQAHLWERLALLRASHVGGDAKLGRQFEAMCRPLVFDPLHAAELPEQIRSLKRRIDDEVVRADELGREIKRGPGGIRELEFFVQTLQMVYGASNPKLQVALLPEAIKRLDAAGLLEPGWAKELIEDYTFLRMVEHRLQMNTLRQTHRLPEDARALDVLARRCGIGGDADGRPGEALMERWRETSRRVHGRFAAFFDGADEADAEEEAADPLQRAVAAVLSKRPEGKVLPLLEPYGLASAGALKSLRRMGGMGQAIYLTSEGRAHYEKLLPAILEVSKSIPRPQSAVAQLESLLGATGALASFYETFERNQPLFRLLMLAFGVSNTMARTLTAHPEFIDYLAYPVNLSAAPGEDDVEGAMTRRLDHWIGVAREDQGFCRALGRFKRFEFLMAGLGELADLLDYPESCRRVTRTAEMILERALARAGEKLGVGADRGFCVMAMGKLGIGELNYYSDLDLVFVWSEGFAEGKASPSETAAALAEELIGYITHSTVEGAIFEVDARLRPEGAASPLAPPLSRYAEYFSGRAQTWEFQSAMRLRPVAGDRELGGKMTRMLREIIMERCREMELAGEIRAMRGRLEAHHKPPRWAFCDFKAGYGGTVDLEFIAQYLQLKHLGEEAALMGQGPVKVFAMAGERGWLGRDVAEELTENYIWLRRLERRTRLLLERDASIVPEGGERLEALERACCPSLCDAGSDLKETVGRVIRRNRRYFAEILGE